MSEKKIKIQPNLLNYVKTYHSFRWTKAQNEIVWLNHKRLNIIHNVLDIPAQGPNKNKIALFWENEKGETKKFTFFELYLLANQFGNFLKSLGVRKKDRVFFFLPRVPELYFGFLGTLKIGAVGGTLFAAFGSQAILERLKNSGAKVLITNKALYPRVEKIARKLPELKKIVLVENLSKVLAKFSVKLKPEEMKPQDPAFMLYTSATGNTPVSGIVIPHQAILQQKLTAGWVLDLKPADTYWCTADPGWVTGVVYGLLAPWSLGITQVIYEGRFDAKRWIQILEKYQVSVWYTAPTAVRMLRQEEKALNKIDFPDLRLIATVGEALNKADFQWLEEKFKIKPLDTWWQTETGAMMMSNYLCLPAKPGSMGKPIPGIKAFLFDDRGKKLGFNKPGNLAFKPNWPSIMVNVWRNPELYKSYFKRKYYFSGDKAYQDKDGYFWFVGRKSEIIKTSGERVGTFEVESAITAFPGVLEAAVIGKPDQLRGEIIKAFVVLKPSLKPSEVLKTKLQQFVKSHLAGHAYPREIDFVKSLPKNKSGKTLRRLLKAKELGLPLGDTSTLEN
jgi:acetyl-CoA synthetase